jgi:hypothetical protein
LGRIRIGWEPTHLVMEGGWVKSLQSLLPQTHLYTNAQIFFP